MRLPSKVTLYKDSIVSKFPVVLDLIQKAPIKPADLYREKRKLFKNLNEYIDVLDCLFALGTVEFDEQENLRYVERNQL